MPKVSPLELIIVAFKTMIIISSEIIGRNFCRLFRLSHKGVYEEAKYFGIYELLPQLESIIEESNELPDERPLSRRDVINATVMTDSNRCDIT